MTSCRIHRSTSSCCHARFLVCIKDTYAIEFVLVDEERLHVLQNKTNC